MVRFPIIITIVFLTLETCMFRKSQNYETVPILFQTLNLDNDTFNSLDEIPSLQSITPTQARRLQPELFSIKEYDRVEPNIIAGRLLYLLDTLDPKSLVTFCSNVTCVFLETMNEYDCSSAPYQEKVNLAFFAKCAPYLGVNNGCILQTPQTALILFLMLSTWIII